MKYFTPELFLRLQSPEGDPANQVDEDWEAAITRYRRRLDRIYPHLPRAIRHLALDLPLHDAQVLSLGRGNGRFLIVLCLDVPSSRTVILTYHLTREPKIDTAALPSSQRSNKARWLYDEVDVVAGKDQFQHDILLSNGWEIRLHFRKVEVFEADALLRSTQHFESSAAIQTA